MTKRDKNPYPLSAKEEDAVCMWAAKCLTDNVRKHASKTLWNKAHEILHAAKQPFGFDDVMRLYEQLLRDSLKRNAKRRASP